MLSFSTHASYVGCAPKNEYNIPIHVGRFFLVDPCTVPHHPRFGKTKAIMLGGMLWYTPIFYSEIRSYARAARHLTADKNCEKKTKTFSWPKVFQGGVRSHSRKATRQLLAEGASRPLKIRPQEATSRTHHWSEQSMLGLEFTCACVPVVQ